MSKLIQELINFIRKLMSPEIKQQILEPQTHYEEAPIEIPSFQSDVVKDIFLRINSERLAMGRIKLSYSNRLQLLASVKAKLFQQTHEWSHDIAGMKWFEVYQKEGYKYTFLGENLAKGFEDPQRLVDAWMQSETHRNVILDTHYEKAGIYQLGKENEYYTVLVVSKE